jgi:hypothetical protein
MIFKSEFPNAPTVNMAIDGVAVNYTSIESLSVSLCENEHDLAELTVVGLIPTAVVEYIGRGVYITIEYGPTQKASFYGYVAFVEPEAIARRGYINNSPIQKARLVCMGTSYDMGSDKSTIWEKKTLPQVVSAIADRYKYSHQAPEDTFVFSRLTQHKESDFAFLVRVCKYMGYRVTVSNGHINVYDPFQSISRAMPFANLTTLVESQGNASFSPGRIMEFSGTFGAVTPDGSSNSFTFETLDNNGNLLSINTKDWSMGLGKVFPAQFDETVSMNAVSFEALQKFAQGAVRNRSPFHASLVVTGIPEVLPGSLIRINKYNTRFDGFWMATHVTHRISRSNYITEINAVRDSTNDEEPTITGNLAYVTPEPPLLTNGVWTSPTKVGYSYAV